ncbi:hypothetical protein ABWK22_01760 [Gottfriedia acidiceleris]|uniref:hypothetical protein n=1 Tax=Gottfriedia acidiceleris TaxID=371036 RepID=UPI003399FC75
MKTENEIQNKIDSYEKERVVMNVKEFDHLLKRVNIEEDNGVKQRILTVIEKYLDVLSVNDIVVPEATQPTMKVESVKEDVVETTNEVVAVEVVQEVEMNQQNAAIEFEKQHEEEVKATETEVAETMLAEQVSLPNEETPVAITPEEEVPVVETVPVVEVKVEEVVQEATPTIEETDTTTVDTTEYVEEFNLISTTNEEVHMKQIIERGGVIFRDKRSFFLMLSLEDEVVAIAKTISIKQFPEHVQKHLKGDGFVTCEVVSFGEVTKRSRARYTNVTYRNLQLLPKDHWIVTNINNLLDKGEEPEHAKQNEVSEEKQVEAASVQPVAQTTQEPLAQEDMYITSSFMLNPSFVETFKTQKEAIMSQTYVIMSANGVAKFVTQSPNGLVVLGVDEKTPLKQNNYSAKILDYTLREQDGQTYAQFKLDANIIEETVQPAPVSQVQEQQPVAEKVNVEVVAKGEVPSDFPAMNKISLRLHPMAETMFSLEAAKGMVGQEVNIGLFTRPEENINSVALMYDVFEMATAINTLTNEELRNSKWLARITDVELFEDPTSKHKVLSLVFDRLAEVESFPYEKPEDIRDVASFTIITEESYAQRQQEIASRQATAQAPVVPVETPAEPVVEQPKQETVSAEALLNKEYNPVEAKQLINPTAGANYAQGYQELVTAQAKDMGGAIQEIRNQTQVTPTSRQEITEAANGVITSVINQTLKDTNIHTQTEQKQTVQVMGNLQDGAGNLTETQTVIHFATGYSPQSWAQSVGKRIDLKSELQLGNGPVTNKLVSMVGKNGAIVGQGQVPMTEALLLDGNQHSATLLGIEGAVQEQQGFIVSLRLGEFNKVA